MYVRESTVDDQDDLERAHGCVCMQIFDPYASGINKVDLVRPVVSKCRVIISVSTVFELTHCCLLTHVHVRLRVQAFANEEHLEPLGSFGTERGQTVPLAKSVSDVSLTDSFSSIYSMGKIMRGRRNSNASSAPSPSSAASARAAKAGLQSSPSAFGSFTPSVASDGACGLTESRFNETDGFSTEGIRKAFLRFFVTLFKKYALYLVRCEARA